MLCIPDEELRPQDETRPLVRNSTPIHGTQPLLPSHNRPQRTEDCPGHSHGRVPPLRDLVRRGGGARLVLSSGGEKLGRSQKEMGARAARSWGPLFIGVARCETAATVSEVYGEAPPSTRSLQKGKLTGEGPPDSEYQRRTREPARLQAGPT